MRRSLITNGMLIVVAVLAIGLGGWGISLVARATLGQRTALTGQTVPLVNHAQLLGATTGQQQLQLSIGLQMRNQQQLEGLLSGIYDPRSPLYHHFLTPQQFAAQFAPTQAEQQQVIDYLHSQGLTVTNVAPNGLLIDATSSVATAETAFGVTINNYHLGARTFYANANPPTIPSGLSSIILSIGGMNNSAPLRPLYQRASFSAARHAHSSQPHIGYVPNDLMGAYDAAPLRQAGIDGSGQTVAVFELDGYQSSDIKQYLQNNNLGTPSISNVLVDGFDGSAGQGAIEVELDIEVVAAMAPSASQLVYEGPNTTQGVNDTYNKIVNDNTAKVTTISWGECEAQSGVSELQTLDGIFKQGAAEGITFFSAAGDSGAYDCGDNNLAVDSPADDPYVTGVGGTNLQSSGGVYGGESVWSNAGDTQRSPNGSGGGGGLSSAFSLPSWQVAPGVQNQYSNGNRQVPDVSADADPQTGYAVYCTVAAAGCPTNGTVTVGGTSAAAPLWAGGTALLNQYLQKQGKDGVGSINPQLYALANAQQSYAPYHDVTSGNNLYYPATAGYDLASGIGSPDFYNLARDIAGGNVVTPTPVSTPGATPTLVPTPTTVPTTVPTVIGTPTTIPTIVPTVVNTPTPPPSSGSLVQNGDFEHGSAPWQESSSGGFEIVDTTNAHSGQYSAYLCGYISCRDTIKQSFSIPNTATRLTISYWWQAVTDRTGSACVDTFNAQLLNSKGKVIANVQHACNANAKQQWQQVTFDASSLLAQYAGQNVTLVFSAKTALSLTVTSFFVDDIAVVQS